MAPAYRTPETDHSGSPIVMAQKTKPRSRPIIEPKKVIEIGVYVTAGQLARLEKILGDWSIKYAVLPQPDEPYADLSEWFEECSQTYKETAA